MLGFAGDRVGWKVPRELLEGLEGGQAAQSFANCIMAREGLSVQLVAPSNDGSSEPASDAASKVSV